MGLISEDIEVKINSRNAKYYEDLGHVIPRWIDSKGDLRVPKGTKITVKVTELQPQSSELVWVECDYCGKRYPMKYFNYVNSVVNGIIHKVACKGECSQKKLEESNLKKYGVKTPYQREEINEKMKHTMIERYGVEYAAQNKELIREANRKKRLPLSEVYQRFKDKGLIPLFHPNYYQGIFQELPFVCQKHGNRIQYITLELLDKSPTGCKECGRDLKMGENHYLWKGGISHLVFYVRSYLNQWKRDSLKQYNYKCALTGREVDAIHHLYSFNLILKETLDNLKLNTYSEINNYNEEEKKLIVEECNRLHYLYGLGIPLTKEIHDLFHKLYGRGNNTPEQFEEFKQRYDNGEFADLTNYKHCTSL